MDYVTFERRLLHLMFRTNAPLTPVHVAYYLDLPIAEARTHLDHLVEMGVLELDSDEKGNMIYNFPMRPKAEALPEPPPPRSKDGEKSSEPRKKKKKKAAAANAESPPGEPTLTIVRPILDTDDAAARALIESREPRLLAPVTTDSSTGPDRQLELVMVDGRRYYSPAAAAALSLFLPGVGQIYTGRVAQGVGWMLATGLGYLSFMIPGLILHICCIVNAAAVPARVPMLAERVR
jgi:TM2 domain-containing membrane protein YozV